MIIIKKYFSLTDFDLTKVKCSFTNEVAGLEVSGHDGEVGGWLFCVRSSLYEELVDDLQRCKYQAVLWMVEH